MRVWSLGLLMVLGCATTQGTGDGPQPNLYVSGEIENAVVWLGDRYLGELWETKRGIRLKPGQYYLRIEADEMFTRYVSIKINPDAPPQRIEVGFVEDLR